MRGTRTFEGKDYFTIYDFVKAYEHFNDPAWDGEPLPHEMFDFELLGRKLGFAPARTVRRA